MRARLAKLPGIRAVAFDIYGTLFISGSGDIGIASATGREEAMRRVVTDAGLADPPTGLVERFLACIRAEHARLKAVGVEFPEVEIREIWQSFLADLGLSPGPEQIERMAIEYECAVNPVWPMPGLAECLETLRKRPETTLAIVSNAQFFTPLLFEAFLDASPEALGFAPELSIYSYAHRQAKPGAALYQFLAKSLEWHGIAPEETLYVGNDMRNDIAPAASIGFRTALFAGDKRSLRLREEDRLSVAPDAVLTELLQIPELVA
jgi:putative hydrolase of the HAD superfamily